MNNEEKIFLIQAIVVISVVCAIGEMIEKHQKGIIIFFAIVFIGILVYFISNYYWKKQKTLGDSDENSVSLEEHQKVVAELDSSKQLQKVMESKFNSQLEDAKTQNKEELLGSFFDSTEDPEYNQTDVFDRQNWHQEQQKKEEEIEKRTFQLEVREEMFQNKEKISEVKLEQARQHTEAQKMELEAKKLQIETQNSLNKNQMLCERQQLELENARAQFKLEKEKLSHYDEKFESKLTQARAELEALSNKSNMTLKEAALSHMSANLLRESIQTQLNIEYEKMERMKQELRFIQSTIQKELQHGRQVDALYDKLDSTKQNLFLSEQRADSLKNELSLNKRLGQ